MRTPEEILKEKAVYKSDMSHTAFYLVKQAIHQAQLEAIEEAEKVAYKALNIVNIEAQNESPAILCSRAILQLKNQVR